LHFFHLILIHPALMMVGSLQSHLLVFGIYFPHSAYLSPRFPVPFPLSLERDRYGKSRRKVRERYAKPLSCSLTFGSNYLFHLLVLLSGPFEFEYWNGYKRIPWSLSKISNRT
jgi:hypothetical protein